MKNLLFYLLLLTSILLETAKTVFSNNFSKNVLKSETDIYKFNFFVYIGSFIVLLFAGGEKASVFTIVTSGIFAIALSGNQYFLLKALNCGPMSFTSFLQCSSLVIPTLFGVLFWDEKITIFHIAVLVVLIFSMALALNLKRETLNVKWLIFALLTMLFMGLIGIMQGVHQMSEHSNELFAFLRCAFLLTVIINFIAWRIFERRTPSTYSIRSSAIVQAGASGVFMGGVHIINLYLAGVMPKIIFFPASNGGLIVMTLLASVVFFKERLSPKQWTGIALATVALCLLGI